jgi:hypothetical protein
VKPEACWTRNCSKKSTYLKPVRPVACNVIDGNLAQVTSVILDLAYGDVAEPEMGQNHRQWKERLPERVRKHT